ncbi:MAG: lysylphosphatidylglycerol synthase transmembrane domain-containing protein [Planctomycetota bacterium]
MRGWFWAGLRLLIAAAGLGYIAYSVRWRPFVDERGVTQPGFLELLGDASPLGLLLVVACMAPLVPLASLRWWVLLRGVEIEATYGRVLRLTWMGQFLNYAVPVGSTGGDVVRAVVAAKWARAQRNVDRPDTPGKMGGALLSLVADRSCGMAGLILLATLAAATRLDDPLSRRVALVGGAVVAAVLLTMALYLALGKAMTQRLGFLRNIRGVGAVAGSLLDTAEAYRRRRFVPVLVAWGLGLTIHIALAGAAVVAAWALGAGLSPGAVFVGVPIALAAASIPLTYQGLGVMEGIAVLMLGVGDDAALTNAVFAVFLIHRLALVVVSLPGAWVLARTGRPSTQPAERGSENSSSA